MSIYASLPGIVDARRYAASHILPADSDERTTDIDLSLIPSHITREGRDDQPEDERPWPWLRVGVYSIDGWALAVINPAQARDLARQLTEWADTAEPTESTEYEEQS
ncbi:MAG: hypothetical protein ACRDTJ_31370 [Pseudonocardiaceae bacterium]